jgi:hypothetical protein
LDDLDFYEVRDGFPRLVGGTLPGGVSGVEYELSLAHCEEFLVEADRVFLHSGGGGNG